MNDLDHDLREMFRRREVDVGGAVFAPVGLRRRVRRRQAGTILKGSLILAVVVIGGLGVRSVVGDRHRPVVTPPTPPPLSMTLRGFGVGFSADGTRLLTRSIGDPGGSIYDPRTGGFIQGVRGPRGTGGPKNTGLLQSFAPDGERFASARGDPATTWVNDATTGTPIWRFRGACCLAAFSPDGHYLAAPCCLRGTRVYDLETGAIANRFDAWGVMAFSPDSSRLVITVGKGEPGRSVAYVWDVLSGRAKEPELVLHGPGGANVAQASVAWSADGSRIAVVAGRPGARNVLVFDAQTGERVFTIDPPSSAVSVAFAPDSSMIVVGGTRGHVSLWQISAPPARPILSFRPHDTEVASVAFSPDGKQLMTGAWHENETKLWNVASFSASTDPS